MINFSIENMMESGIHFGHKTKNWNPKMKPYIFGIYNGIHIINLDITIKLFNKALINLKNIYNNNGKILFVGTKRISNKYIKDLSINCNQYYINNRWLGGTLTNLSTIKKSIKKLKYLEENYNNKNFIKNLTKKEYLIYTRKLNKLLINLDGIRNMNVLPDALFIVDTIKENIAIKEANKLKIPIFAITDTNSNPDEINFIIPGNDDSEKSIKFYTNKINDYLLDNNI